MILAELKTVIVLEGVTYPQGAVAPDFLFIWQGINYSSMSFLIYAQFAYKPINRIIYPQIFVETTLIL